MRMKKLRVLAVVVFVACGSSPKRAPVSRAELTSSALSAVVVIRAGTDEINGFASESEGFVVDASGLIATSLHGIEGESNLRVVLHDAATEYPVTAVTGVDPARDLALVRIAAKGPLPAVRLGDSNAIAAGARVHAIGHEGLIDGTIREVRALSPALTILQVQVPNPKSWDGPVFDEYGDVVGLTTNYITLPSSVLAVPVNYIKRLMANQVALAPDEFAKQTAKPTP